MQLRPRQAIALYEALQMGGMFGALSVGAGKTLVSFLLPSILEAMRPVLLLPAGLIEKTWHDRKILAEHWNIPTNLQIIFLRNDGQSGSCRASWVCGTRPHHS